MARPLAARAVPGQPQPRLPPALRGLRLRVALPHVALLTGALSGLRRRRRLRYALLALATLAPLLGGGFVWLGHSSLVAVRRVQVSGVHGPEAAEIEAALDGAAKRMSTLDVHPAALRAAVAAFPLVRDLRVSTSFPHTLRVRVVEQPPVAALHAGAARTAVAADGVVLGPALLVGASLPSVSANVAPAPGRAVGEVPLREVLTVLGAVPAPLQRFVVRATSGAKGIEVTMRSGLVAYFGAASRPHAKWLALALVLSSERAAGASYIDVRVPERPAAGYPPGAGPPASAQEGESSGSNSGAAGGGTATPESTAAAIAARLSAAVGVGEGASEQHHPAEEEAAASESGGESKSGGGAGGGSGTAGGESPRAAGGQASDGSSSE